MRRHRLRTSLLVLASVVCGLAGSQSAVRAQEPSNDGRIVRALLRDIAIPWRDGSQRNATKPIAVVMDSLQQCPPPPEAVRGCVMPEVVNWARFRSGQGHMAFRSRE